MEINWALIMPIIVIQVILVVIALVDLLRREKTEVNGSKILWVLIIIFINLIGPIIYFVIGRKRD